jgi:hypothetical protein
MNDTERDARLLLLFFQVKFKQHSIVRHCAFILEYTVGRKHRIPIGNGVYGQLSYSVYGELLYQCTASSHTDRSR